MCQLREGKMEGRGGEEGEGRAEKRRRELCLPPSPPPSLLGRTGMQQLSQAEGGGRSPSWAQKLLAQLQ